MIDVVNVTDFTFHGVLELHCLRCHSQAPLLTTSVCFAVSLPSPAWIGQSLSICAYKRVSQKRDHQRAVQSWSSPLSTRCSGVTPSHGHEDKMRPLPQTIEYSLQCAKEATRQALLSGILRISIELPMGRSRKYWYKMAPLDDIYEESSLLATHFCEMFQGARIKLVLGAKVALGLDAKKVPWIDKVDFVNVENGNGVLQLDSFDVVVIAAVDTGRAWLLQEIVNDFSSEVAIVVLNCCLEDELREGIPDTFVQTYLCRSVEKGAVLKYRHSEDWHVFDEIAVFDYDWVCRQPSSWRPTRVAVEEALIGAGAQRESMNGYYKSSQGLEAGFWPFMTIAVPFILPVEGAFPEHSRLRRTRAPFGFF